MKEPFADILKRYRRAAGLSQERLADLSGLSVRGISDLERGTRTRPQRETRARLANALQLTGLERDRFVNPPAGNLAHSEGWDPSAGSGQVVQLIGRAAELSLMMDAAVHDPPESRRAVVLSGEAGVGKTHLARAFAERLQGQGHFVLMGRCYESHRNVPFHPVVRGLGRAFEAVSDDVRNSVAEKWPYLGWLVSRLPTAHLDPDMRDREQMRLLLDVLGFLRELNSERPLAVVLDDLEWMDDSTAQLLHLLIRHVPQFGFSIAGTYRSAEIDPETLAHRGLLELQHDGLIEPIPLRRLDTEFTSRLVEATIGPARASLSLWIFEQTDGNPLLTKELARALVEGGRAHRRHGKWELVGGFDVQVPSTVSDLVEQRRRRLSHATQEAVACAAVVGHVCTLELASAALDWPQSSAQIALDEAVRCGLMRHAVDGAYVFDHSLTRQAVYEQIPAGTRRHIHLKVAGVLESVHLDDQAGTSAEIARHLLQGGAVEAAEQWLIRAGDEAERVFAHNDALTYFEQALDIAITHHNSAHEAAALERLAGVLVTLGRYDEAIDRLMPAPEHLLDAGAVDQLASFLRTLVAAHAFRGTPRRGLQDARPYLQSLEGAAPTPAVAALHVQLSTLAHFDARYEEQLELSERAAEVARRTGDSHVLAEAEDVRGYALCLLGRPDEGIVLLQRSLSLAEAAGFRTCMSNASGHLGITYLLMGRMDEARRATERALHEARQMGDPVLISIWLALLGFHAMFSGDWRHARRHCEESTRVVQDLGHTVASPLPLFVLGWVEALQGKRDRAADLLDESARVAGAQGNLQACRMAAFASAEMELRSGQADNALARLDPLLDRGECQEQDATLLLPLVAWAHLELGNIDKAQATIEQAVARCRRQNLNIAAVHALYTQALVAGERGMRDVAMQALDEGRELASAMPYPYMQARMAHETGVLQRAEGDEGSARRSFLAALAAFERLGAQPDIERTRRAVDMLSDR